MSGRIRSIKPELLDDAVTAGLSDMAFRVFIAAIVLADDYGRLRAEPGWLLGQVYWARGARVEDFERALRELDSLIRFYEVKGQRYAEIRNWSRHQKVSHPGKPRVPAPSENPPRLSGESPETLVPDLRSPIPIPITDHRPSESPTGVREKPESANETASVQRVWEVYLAGWKTNVGTGPEPKLTDQRRRQIRARLRDHPVEDIVRACESLWTDPFMVENRHTGIEQVVGSTQKLEKRLARAPTESTPMLRAAPKVPDEPGVPPPPGVLEAIEQFIAGTGT